MIGSVVRFLQPPDPLHGRRAALGIHAGQPDPARHSNGRWCPPRCRRGAPPEPRRRFDERRAAVERHYRTWRQAGSRWTTDVAQVRRRAPARDRRPARALYGSGRRGRDLRRHPVVLHRLRPRLDHHVARDAGAQSRHRARHAALPRPPPGRREDPFTEEQPGRILHELRRGEMARAGEIPHIPYFGTRRRDAALARPAARDLALDRRRRAGDGAAAQRRARAGLDRPVRRCRRRRVRGVRPHAARRGS